LFGFFGYPRLLVSSNAICRNVGQDRLLLH
jgi:hypothetical protein